jgi:hypothetical protein
MVNQSIRGLGWTLLVAAFATTWFGLAFVGRWFPLGIPAQFEYPRLGPWDVPMATWPMLALPAVAGLVMIALVVWSMDWIDSVRRRVFFSVLAAVMLFGGAFQVSLEIAAPNGLGKWAALFHSFRYAARTEFNDASSVLANHAEVARSFEPNHISANPVGWILINRLLLSFFDRHHAIAEAVWTIEPHEVAWSLRDLAGARGVPLADQATVTTVAYLNRFAAILVGLPVAWLVRQRFSRSAALVATAMSMLVPALVLQAPWADSVYPTFSTGIVALSYYASRNRSWVAAAAAGTLIAIGMLFSLSFVVVAALCALIVATRAVQGQRPTIASVIAAPLAWALVLVLLAGCCGHRAWETWQVNLQKNREFNEFNGCDYAPWVFANLGEMAVSIGIPASTFLIARIGREIYRLKEWRAADAVFLAWTTVVTLLAVSGVNRGEVSRLWLFLMPLAAALSSEQMVDSRKGVRTLVVAGALILQMANSLVLGRELLLVWHRLPHDAAEVFSDYSQASPWQSVRRLTDAEYERRTGKRPSYDNLGASDDEIHPGQTAYLWSPTEERVAVAVDAQAYERFVRAKAGTDAAALDELTTGGSVALLPQNTTAIVVKLGAKTDLVRIVGDPLGQVIHAATGDVHRRAKPLK